MRSVKSYLLPLFAVLAITACSKEGNTGNGGGDSDFHIVASIESAFDIEWKAQDELKVVCDDELYTFVTTEEGETANFKDSEGTLDSSLIGDNPVTAYVNCSSMYGAFRIQAEQQAAAGVNTTRIPMYAYTVNAPEDESLPMTFKPMASMLELVIQPYDITVDKLTITPAEDAAITNGAMAGEFKVEAAQSTVAANNGINSIVVEFPGGLNLSNATTLSIPMGWFNVEGGLELTFRYGTTDYTTTIWDEEDLVVKTYEEKNGFKQARLMRETFEFDANLFPRAYYVKADGATDSKGISWDAPASLSSALKSAVSGSTLHLAAGTYTPDRLLTGGENAEGHKTFEISQNITIIGGYPAGATNGATANPDTNETILSGNNTSFHTMVVAAPKYPNEKVVINGITIRDGNNTAADNKPINVNDVNIVNNYAAGVAVLGTTVEFVNCNIIENNGNSATGLFAIESDITVTDCTISDNTSDANGGGAWITSGCDLTMTGTTIKNNTAVLAAGLYLHVPEGQALKADIVNCIVSENTCSEGTAVGGIYVRDDSGDNLLESSFTGCTISNNAGAMGAGIKVLNAKTTLTDCVIADHSISGNGVTLFQATKDGNTLVIFDNCTIHNNETTGEGVSPALYPYSTGGNVKMVVQNSTIHGNTSAGRGGAIYARYEAGSKGVDGGSVEVTCVNTTFTNNQSKSWGSAITCNGNADRPVTVNMISCTITDNSGNYAVVAETAGNSIYAYNTIISGNRSNDGTPADIKINNVAAKETLNYTIVGENLFDNEGNEQPLDPVFTAATMIAPLADNGGKTQTCKLIGDKSNNLAFVSGMTATALKAMATAEIKADVLGADQTGAQRNDTNLIVGACIK